jgi:hypothetical protein
MFFSINRFAIFISLVILGVTYCTWAAAISVSHGSLTPRGCELNRAAIILSGEIREGDTRRLQIWLKNNPQLFLTEQPPFLIDSNGGSVLEAMKLGELLESIVATAWVTPSCVNSGEPPNSNVRFFEPQCLSACFALIAASPNRIIHPQHVGLHRPYFDPSDYKNMKFKNARIIYEEATKTFSDWLLRKSIPKSLVETMMLQSSKDMYMLTELDAAAIGQTAPWLEEFVIARCKYQKGLFAEWSDAVSKNDRDAADTFLMKLNGQSMCIRMFIQETRMAWLKNL